MVGETKTVWMWLGEVCEDPSSLERMSSPDLIPQGSSFAVLIPLAGPVTGHGSTLGDSMAEVRSWSVLKDRLDGCWNLETLGRSALILSRFWQFAFRLVRMYRPLR